MKSPNKITVQALLLTAALAVAYFGFTTVLQVGQQYRVDGVTHREAVLASKQRQSAPSSASQQRWHRVWTLPVGASLAGAPAAWSNGLVVTAGKGTLLALDNTGSLRWRHTYSNLSFAGSPVVAGDVVVAAGSDGEVIACDLVTGQKIWQVKTESVGRHGPLAMRSDAGWQVVLLSSANGVLRCLDARDGRERWHSEPTNRSEGAPGAAGDVIAYGNCDSAVHLFDPSNGVQRAAVPLGEEAQMAGGVLVLNNRVYGGTRAGSLVCVDAVENRVCWQVRLTDSEAFGTPVAAGDQLFMGTRDGHLSSVAAQDGKLLWQVSLSNEVKSLCVVEDAVFVSAGGSLVGVRSRDGHVFQRLPVGDELEGPVWNGRILVVEADGGNIVGFRGE